MFRPHRSGDFELKLPSLRVEDLRAFAIRLRRRLYDAEARMPISQNDARLVLGSGLFEKRWYRMAYPEVAASDLSPLDHFLTLGGAKGLWPSPMFHSDWYLSTYSDGLEPGTNPLVHYLRVGVAEKFNPNPFFISAWYLETYPDVVESGLEPLKHYDRYGAAEGRAPSPEFDPAFYLRTYPDVASSGVAPLRHFLTIGAGEGRAPRAQPINPARAQRRNSRPQSASSLAQGGVLDIFDDALVQAASGWSRDAILWAPQDPAKISDAWSAMRWMIDRLRYDAELRHRFPHALSAGAEGGFAVWLESPQAAEGFGLGDAARTWIRKAFSLRPAERARQIYMLRSDQSDPPLGLTPIGQRDLMIWLLGPGVDQYDLRLEEVWWLALEAAEQPAFGLMLTYLFTPDWQRRHPDAMTVFGAPAFKAWFQAAFGVDAAWTDPAAWPASLSPAQQIRLAYFARETWRRAQPYALESSTLAQGLLSWLKTAGAALTPAALTWLEELDDPNVVADLTREGVNLISHFCYPSGLRNSALSIAEGLGRNGLSTAVRDVWVNLTDTDADHFAYRDLEVHDVTLLHIQPEPHFAIAYDRAGLWPRQPRTYRIGYWYWELEDAPKAWMRQARSLDEIWCGSRFVADALRRRIRTPVFELPPGLEIPPFQKVPRSHFGLPDNQFLFLFTFHMTSIMERKNPLGLIRAFRAAFGDDPGVGLVIKTAFANKHPPMTRALVAACEGANIHLIDAIYSQEEILALAEACDAFVSLHRSEGFGLGIAEAMLLAKPSVATGYSGNLDFMDESNSFLVDYERVRVGRGLAPYTPGSYWAEPKIDHAVEQLRRVYADPATARARGEKAQADLQRTLSLAAAGHRMAARLEQIRRERRALRG